MGAPPTLDKKQIMIKDKLTALKQNLESLPHEELVDLVIQLHGHDKTTDERITYLANKNNPKEQAKLIKKRIQSIKRGSRFIPYRESYEFSLKVESILADCEPLISKSPKHAFELLDAFMASNEGVFKRLDDSGGSVGDIYRCGVEMWISAARQFRHNGGEKIDWQKTVLERFAANGYSVWDTLLKQSAALLTDDELKKLAWRFENEARKALATHTEPRSYCSEAANARLGLAGVARALKNVELYERATLISCPAPNELQKLDLARFCLLIGNIERALHWLDGKWEGYVEGDKRKLLDECYSQGENTTALLELRTNSYENDPSYENLQDLKALLSPKEQEKIQNEAIDKAMAMPVFCFSIDTLIKLNAIEAAEKKLFAQADSLKTESYEWLINWVSYFSEHEKHLAVVLCYRALIDDILEAGRSKGYNHAAKYFKTLQVESMKVKDYRTFPDRLQYIDQLEGRHKLKRSFWAKVTTC